MEGVTVNWDMLSATGPKPGARERLPVMSDRTQSTRKDGRRIAESAI
jgi:hypothetical protein